jgi:pimeloyl-ACP methyl ester carboxylesterase
MGKKVELYVQDWGAGKTIVFIHGWPLDHRIFEYQMMELAKRDCRVVSIDLRGFGQSEKPWDGNDYDTWAIDIGKVIADLILRDVTLAGFSMGGAIAAHYVARRIDTRISKLALISAPVPSFAPRQEDRQALEGHMKDLLADRPKFMREYIKTIMHTDISREHLEWFASLGMTASLRACLRGLEELRDRDLRPMLGNIRVPTRFFHGAQDRIIPFSLAESQVGLIRGASLVRFENSGHGLFWDERDKLVEELNKFAGEKVAIQAA